MILKGSQSVDLERDGLTEINKYEFHIFISVKKEYQQDETI